MKFELALATVLATESLSSSVLALQDAPTSLAEQGQRKTKAAHTIHKLTRNLGKQYPSSHKAQGKRKNEALVRRLSASAKAQGIDVGILSSISSSKLQNGGSSVGRSNTGPDLGIFASTVTQEQSKVEFSHDRQMQFYSGNFTEASCPGYTDACNCSSDCIYNAQACSCEEGLACCAAYFEQVADMMDALADILNRPMAAGAEYYCQYLSGVEGACTTCQVTDFIDPDTGLATDAYNIDINCPNIPPELSEGGESLADGFMAYCSGAAFCEEGAVDCPPLCQVCNVDVENNIIDAQNCLLEGGIGGIIEDAFEDAFDELEDTLEEVSDVIDDLYERPLASLISYSCYALDMISSFDPNTDPYCTTCEVVDLDTGNYNIDMNCPNFASAGDDIIAEAANLFLYLGYACDSGLCESCNLDQENFMIDLNSCHLDNFSYFTATSPTSTSTSTSPPGEIEDPVDVVIISKDGPETADEPDTETGASEAESGGHSPRSTLLALMLVGASWCWMAA